MNSVADLLIITVLVNYEYIEKLRETIDVLSMVHRQELGQARIIAVREESEPGLHLLSVRHYSVVEIHLFGCHLQNPSARAAYAMR